MINIREANKTDIDTYFKWANEDSVRKQSFNSEMISYEEHQNWFNNQLNDKDCFMYVFSTNRDIGQVRIQKISNNDAIINISLDQNYRGKGFGVKMLLITVNIFKNIYPKIIINAYIKIENVSSKIIFEKSGFVFQKSLTYKNILSYHYIKV
jgi:spore coat polysaccharide biosynthesis protein SpsF